MEREGSLQIKMDFAEARNQQSISQMGQGTRFTVFALEKGKVRGSCPFRRMQMRKMCEELRGIRSTDNI